MDSATNLGVTLNGNAVANVASYRVQSPVFGIILPQNNILQSFGFPVPPWFKKPVPGKYPPPGEYAPLVDDGYYIMLVPLSPGQHVLNFHGGVPGFTLNVTYKITVVPK
jgi:hypothetical protein